MKQTRLQTWLQIQSLTKPKIYAQVYAGSHMRMVPYWLEIALSAGIATLGLVLSSPAVIIGAMLISPLMAPIMATGLGLAVGDLYLAVKSFLKLAASIALALLISALLVWILPFHSPTTEILARTNPTLLDLGIALLSGLAGSLAVSRSVDSADGVTTVPGVAIAVALMPPLCTIGFGIGSGLRTDIVRGAGLLFITNIVAIIFSAFLVFLSVGLNSEVVRAEVRRSRDAEPFAQRLEHGPFAPAMSTEGHLHWRLLLLIVLLGAIAWPLQAALRQLTSEARTRDLVEREIKTLIPSSQLVSEQTEVGHHSVAVRVVVTGNISGERIQQVEQAIRTSTGRQTSILVQSVASRSELAKLVERLREQSTPPAQVLQAPPPPPSLEQQQATLLDQLATVLASVWPQQTPLAGFDLTSGPDSTIVHARYTGLRPLTKISLQLLTQTLQEKLKAPELVLNATYFSSTKRRSRRQHLRH